MASGTLSRKRTLLLTKSSKLTLSTISQSYTTISANRDWLACCEGSRLDDQLAC